MTATKKNPLIGAHISISGGLYKSVARAEEIGCTSMQIFTKSNRQWFDKRLTPDEISQFKDAVKNSNLSHIVTHAAYLINIASSNPDTEKKSITSLKQELQRCEQLEIPNLVLHPGSHTGQGEEAGLEKLVKNLDTVLAEANGTTKILLETMAGQGTNLGYTFEHLKSIIQGCKNEKNLGICLDTCHIFSAGYDISTPKKHVEVMDDFCKTVGIRRLKAIHLNGSKTPCGSRKDRHEVLEEGTIPLTAFKRIMEDERFVNVPKILETPDPARYAKEIALLKKMA